VEDIVGSVNIIKREHPRNNIPGLAAAPAAAPAPPNLGSSKPSYNNFGQNFGNSAPPMAPNMGELLHSFKK